MTPQTTKVENGKIVLPKQLRKAWKEAKIFLFPNEDTLVVKRIRKPLAQLSELASRVSSTKLSRKEIEKEIQAFRNAK